MLKQIPVFGCPRSGTSWLGQILNSSPVVLYRFQPLFSYEFKDYFIRYGVNEGSVVDFATELLGASSPFVETDVRFAKKKEPTHLVWKEVRYHQLIPALVTVKNISALIYIFRDPLHMINSWYCAPKEFLSGWDIRKEFMDAPMKNVDANEYNGLNKWLESTELVLNNLSRKMLVVSYEDLVSSPMGIVIKLFDRLGIAVDRQVKEFVGESTTKACDDPYSVYRDLSARRENESLALPDDVKDAILGSSRVQNRYRELVGVAI